MQDHDNEEEDEDVDRESLFGSPSPASANPNVMIDDEDTVHAEPIKKKKKKKKKLKKKTKKISHAIPSSSTPTSDVKNNSDDMNVDPTDSILPEWTTNAASKKRSKQIINDETDNTDNEPPMSAVDQVTNIIIQAKEDGSIRPLNVDTRGIEFPKSSEHAMEFLKGYSTEVTIRSFRQALKLKTLPTNIYSYACLCVELYDITNQVIGRGLDIPDKNEEWVVKCIIRLRDIVSKYVITKYDELKSYTLPRASSRWNTISLSFLINSNLFIILDSLLSDNNVISKLPDEYNFNYFNMMKSDDDHLGKLEIIVYPSKKVRDYTMLELQNTLACLSSKWFELEYSKELENYVYRLELRAAYIVVGRMRSDVMDGMDDRDRTPIITKSMNPNRRRDLMMNEMTYACSSEYISDVFSILARFKQSLYFRTSISSEIIEVDITKTWEGYKPKLIFEQMTKWFNSEASLLQGPKFKDDIRQLLLTVAGKRLGDAERFTRANAGLTETDPMTVIEESRTPMQSTWWNSTLVQGGVPKLLHNQNKFIRSLTIAKVFHRWCETWMKFNWWIHCFYLEATLRRKTENLQLHEEPLIIQQMGEFNIWFAKKVYRTKTIEYAIIMWVVVMCNQMDAKFKGMREEWDLSPIRNQLNKWCEVIKSNNNNETSSKQNEKSKSHQQSKREANPININKEETDDAYDIFCEVVDTIFM